LVKIQKGHHLSKKHGQSSIISEDPMSIDLKTPLNKSVHLDLKGVPPTPERLLSLLDVFKGLGFNSVLVEWEDTFPWTVDERFRSSTAYSPECITEFCRKAKTLDLEVIPLIQCLGHMENTLSVPGYEHLREIADNESGLDPMAPGARELIQSMVDDVMKLMPEVKYFHLGGDEARTLGQGEESGPYAKQYGKAKLYMRHVEPLLDDLMKKGIQPMLWHDMMIDWSGEELSALSKKCDLVVWAYGGDPASNGKHCNEEMIQKFKKHGCQLWGAGAYKGAEGYDADLPDLALHVENTLGWVNLSKKIELEGLIATAWSRYAVDTIQCNPIDSSLDSMASFSIIMKGGSRIEGVREEALAVLDQMGEKERFIDCSTIMKELSTCKKDGWEKVQHARQVLTLAKNDPARTSAKNPNLGLHAMVSLKKIIENGEEIHIKAKQVFEGLMETVWLDEYFNTRLQPLKDELVEITNQYKSL